MSRIPTLILAALAAGDPLAGQSLVDAPSGSTALLQAVSPVDDAVVWVSGHRGTVLRSLDGGLTWESRPVTGADSLQFRDVHARSASVAWVMSAGPGTLSQIHHTRDGGATWVRQFLNTDSTAFYDCLTMFDDRVGVAYSDASRGRTNILRTTDAGEHWQLLPAEAVPAPLDGEGAFAASGGCVTSFGRRNGWMALGSPAARFLRSRDAGATWQSTTTPIVSGEAAGNTAVHFRDPLVGMVVGGDIAGASTDTSAAAVAVTLDGGETWTLRSRPPRPGALFGVSWVPGASVTTAVAASPGGLFVTRDAGQSWTTVDERPFWSVAASGRRAWAVGPRGVIVVLTF
jgi:photosystem II stability/assembly factor-like uncharacterized protein